MNKSLEKAQDIFLEKVNKICREFGLNNVMAQLYTVLYLSNEPLSLNDMVERLKISKGSVSVNIRGLERYGVAKRIWVKGSRRDYYEAETDIYKVISDRIKAMTNRRLSEVENMIKSVCKILDLIEAKDAKEKESVGLFKQRVNKLKGLHNRAQSLFNLLNSGILNGLLNSKTAKQDKKELLL